METELVNPLSCPGWDRLLSSHQDAVIFHSAAWARVLSKTYGHQPMYLRCSHNGEVAALIPMMEIRSALTGWRGVCLPFSDFCKPLIFDEVVRDLALKKLPELARLRKWKYFELRGGRAPDIFAKPSVTYYGHTLDLRVGAEKLLAKSASPVRRAIRKAVRSNLSVEAGHEGISEFYRLHVQTRRRHGLPPQPVTFFQNIHEEIIKPGSGFIVLAKTGGRSVAGAVFFQYGSKAIFKFGASDQHYQEFRGNDLVMWGGIERLARAGCEILHLGRTSMENMGLRRFKLAWGTTEERMEYFKFDVVRNRWIARRDEAPAFYTAVFGRLPLAVNRMAGTIIYPHLD